MSTTTVDIELAGPVIISNPTDGTYLCCGLGTKVEPLGANEEIRKVKRIVITIIPYEVISAEVTRFNEPYQLNESKTDALTTTTHHSVHSIYIGCPPKPDPSTI